MYGPVSEEFLAAVRGSGKRVVIADLYYTNGLVQRNIPVYQGNIDADSNADIRRHGQISMVNPSVVGPTASTSGRVTVLSSPATIYGTEVVVKAGVEYSSGNQETVPLGRFVIWTSDISYEDGDVIDLELYDRSKYLASSGIVKFYDASGQSATTAIQNLCNLGLPALQTVQFDDALTDIVMPAGTTYDSTYLDAILDLSEAIGAEFYFDLLGNAICAPKPFIDQNTSILDAVYTTDCGEEGVITALGKTTTRDSVFNGIGVYGVTPNGSAAQPFAEVYDLDPASPTYYNGPFGKAFKRIDRPELTNSDQCLAVAKAELAASTGVAKGISLQTLPIPILEPGDVIKVVYPDDTEELHQIDTIGFDIASQTFDMTTKGRNG